MSTIFIQQIFWKLCSWLQNWIINLLRIFTSLCFFRVYLSLSSLTVRLFLCLLFRLNIWHRSTLILNKLNLFIKLATRIWTSSISIYHQFWLPKRLPITSWVWIIIIIGPRRAILVLLLLILPWCSPILLHILSLLLIRQLLFLHLMLNLHRLHLITNNTRQRSHLSLNLCNLLLRFGLTLKILLLFAGGRLVEAHFKFEVKLIKPRFVEFEEDVKLLLFG